MEKTQKKNAAGEALIFLVVFTAFFFYPVRKMGFANMLNTMMNTAYSLLMDTCFYIMAIAVLAGALSSLLLEFGVIDLLNRLLSPLMKPLWNMPGSSALGILTCYCSDNPAILTVANDTRYRKYFKAYQIPALTNLGTAFGMGLIVTSFMLGLGNRFGSGLWKAVLCGNLGAVIGSIISTRIMLHFSRKIFGPDREALETIPYTETNTVSENEKPRGFMKVIEALLDGGKVGVQMGMDIIPGVLVICTLVMLLTYGPGENGYTGAAYEGIAVLPWIGEKLRFLLTPLFGFSNEQCVSVPVTALGSAGASLGIVRTMVESGSVSSNDISVFTAMCMCWSGYLSTHISMMDALHCRSLTGRSILAHTIGGFCAGIAAHLLYLLF